MRPTLQEIETPHTPETLVARLRAEGASGVALLRSLGFEHPQARYSLVAAEPFLRFQSRGAACRIEDARGVSELFGNPWRVLEQLVARCELLDEVDLPFPLGGCFGSWGYELKNFVEPRLPRRAVADLDLPDCAVGFYDSLVVFDHVLGKVWIVSTGLDADGSRSVARARAALECWRARLETEIPAPPALGNASDGESHLQSRRYTDTPPLQSNLTREQFIAAVERAQAYIRAGDIYQVNLSHRLEAAIACDGWELFQRLSSVSPAPFAAYFDHGGFEIVSSSPERFLQLSGPHIETRPIKGTRPRGADADADARLSYELQSSAKERAELVMITDLLRNDLGRVCEFGSVRVPELMHLEKFAQVQHLVSTVRGTLRAEVSHFAALAACFPGGSITGAPKIRAMEIIDELEPVSRAFYCGAHGCLGFNRESQLAISIRTAMVMNGRAVFPVGAGIVADSDPAAEYEETLAKGAGFVAALRNVECRMPNAEGSAQHEVRSGDGRAARP